MPKSRKQAFFNPGHGGRAIFLLSEIYVRDHIGTCLLAGAQNWESAGGKGEWDYWERPRRYIVTTDAPTGRPCAGVSAPPLVTHSFPSTSVCCLSAAATSKTIHYWDSLGRSVNRGAPNETAAVAAVVLEGVTFRRRILIVVALRVDFSYHSGTWRVVRNRKTAHCALLQIEKLKAFCEKIWIILSKLQSFLLRVANPYVIIIIIVVVDVIVLCDNLYTLFNVLKKLNGSSRSISFAELNNCLCVL